MADVEAKGLRIKGVDAPGKPILVIGIDTGVQTGFACWNTLSRQLLYVETVKIHQAMVKVQQLYKAANAQILVRVEDARKRKFFGNTGREKLQGAGSVKRDAVIWEDFLSEHGIRFEMVAPKNNATKMDADYFRKITGWPERTSNHARDAAMLCWGWWVFNWIK